MANLDVQPPPLDSDEPLYARGFILGMAWEALRRDGWIEITVDGAAAEMCMRVADHLGVPFSARPVAGDCLEVVMGQRAEPEPAPVNSGAA